MKDATHCLSLLDSHEINNQKLAARLDIKPGAVETGAAVFNCRKIKISWWTPQASAVAYYCSARSAQLQAMRLNGKEFDGTPLKISYSSYRRGSTSVLIQGLPDSVDEKKLQRFCGAEDISIRRSVDDKPIPDTLRSILEQFGPLEALECLPTSSGSTKAVAFARFTTPAAAESATQSLNGKSQEFLAGKPIWLEQVFSVKYSLSVRHFFKIQAEIQRLQKEIAPETRIRYYVPDGTSVAFVPLLLDASSPKSLGRVKLDLQSIVQGEVIMEDGKVLWDDYFASPDGESYIESTNSDSNHPFFLIINPQIRNIRLAGSSKGRVTGKTLVLDKLHQVRQSRHVLNLSRDVMWALIKGGLQNLHSQLGKDKITLNIVSRTLTVDGTNADIDYVKRLIAEIQPNASGNARVSDSDTQTICPACFTEVIDPISLTCGHVFCTECLQLFLRSACSDFKLLCCPAVQSDVKTMCDTRVTFPVIRRLLNSSEEGALLRTSFLSYVASHPNEYQFCPSPDCEMVYPSTGAGGTVIQCPSCLLRICSSCHVEVHEGLSCPEYQDQREGGYVVLEKWKAENGVKQCPKCRVDIQKAGGCNHMTCAVCKVHICWICMETFRDSDSGGGVYAHIRNVHGPNALYM